MPRYYTNNIPEKAQSQLQQDYNEDNPSADKASLPYLTQLDGYVAAKTDTAYYDNSPALPSQKTNSAQSAINIRSLTDILDLAYLKDFCATFGPNYTTALSDYFSKTGNAFIAHCKIKTYNDDGIEVRDQHETDASEEDSIENLEEYEVDNWEEYEIDPSEEIAIKDF